jgi:hypothetical protein
MYDALFSDQRRHDFFLCVVKRTRGLCPLFEILNAKYKTLV